MELVPPLRDFFAHLFRRAFVKSVTDVGCEFFVLV